MLSVRQTCMSCLCALGLGLVLVWCCRVLWSSILLALRLPLPYPDVAVRPAPVPTSLRLALLFVSRGGRLNSMLLLGRITDAPGPLPCGYRLASYPVSSIEPPCGPGVFARVSLIALLRSGRGAASSWRRCVVRDSGGDD